MKPLRRINPDKRVGESRGSPRAFALVEMLLALVLAAAVLTATARIAVQTVATEQAAGRIQDDRQRRAHLFDLLGADVAARLSEQKGNAVAIRLDPNHRPEIEILCLASSEREDGTVVWLPQRATYRLTRCPHATDHLRFVREVTPLIEHGSTTVIMVADCLTAFGVAYHESGEWKALSGSQGADSEDVDAIRTCCRWTGDEQDTCRTFVLDDALSGSDRDGR